ncbi:MAG TPA: CRTAC1 family protein [Planctomycetota bacterium]|nr:CRTAC1 family protein [Planctomycetota bacterium]
MRRALLALAIGGGCGGQEAPPPPSPVPPLFHFTEETVPTVVWCGRKEKPHLLESGGSGLALFDYDGDSDLDLYVVNGWRLDGDKVVEKGRNALWRNRGDGTFEDVTDSAGVGDDGWGCGVAVGDVDGDGDPDLFVTNFGRDVLYVNRGDGTFARAPDPPGIDGWSAGAVFLDADGDGDEDLFVGAYIDCTLDEVLHAKPTLDWHGAKVMLGPFGLTGKRNAYFENAGGGRFVEATGKAGLTDVGAYFSFGVMALDLDGDLDLDLYVANDSNPNYLYRNEGKGRFKEVGLWSGAALDAGGAAQAGMGVGAGDVDGDGDPDLLVTNFEKDATTLYRNDGRCLFADVSEASGVKAPTYAPLSWGTALEDFDLDGDLDIFIANGHIYPQADALPDAGTSYAQANLLLANRGDGRFTDASRDAGPGLSVVRSSRGVAAGDLDNDGDIDLVVSNVDATPTILVNGTVRRGRWLLVDAPGARKVTVEAGGRRWTRHEVRGGSFCSASDPRFHFGLGKVDAIDRVTVTWPDGSEQAIRDAAPDRIVRVARNP